MTRATWLLIVAAVLQGGALSAPDRIIANATAFVETQVRAAEHRVVCQPMARAQRAGRRIIAI